AGFRVDGKSSDCAGFFTAEIADFANGIQKVLGWIDRQERGIGRFAGEGLRGQFTGSQVQLEAINSFARASRIGPDVDPEFLVFGFGRWSISPGYRHQKKNQSDLKTACK